MTRICMEHCIIISYNLTKGELKMEFTYEIIEADAKMPVKYIIHNMPDAVAVPRHWHEALEISYTIKGSVQNFYIDGTNYTTKQGDIFVINSNAIHSVFPNFEENRKAISLFFTYGFLKENIPKIAELEFCTYIGDESEALQKLLDEFIKEVEGNKNSLHLKALIFEIMYILVRDFSAPKKLAAEIKTEKHLGRLTEITSYMRENYTEEIAVSDLARHFHLTSEYFSRFFKKYMGATVLEYLELIRLNRAYQLLMNTDKAISYIAYSSGFPNEKSFTRVFKKVYLSTPNKYRTQNKKS
ncbi:AraC family transcriptional regulator [Listeria monocytogenes]|nr:AraC family transcriptional regulator [Listeria monocytogenes]EAC9721761.1 AraC family transcriptional regulator [Listeria monocytogenes]EAC9864720.1 AraC family transcriptional regulator [Listeria monocytogenes]EAD0296480.1 AraC family transcriptional regulator [Listeria monocytogenes]EAD0385894.1 AraC family transcriptional regulator [Listeria monocytogenes]